MRPLRGIRGALRRRAERRCMRRQNDGTLQNKPMTVGMEAAAEASLAKNRKLFKYPEEGFLSPIEFSLLYNILKEPKIYPLDVIRKHILEEDFEEYLYLKGDCDIGNDEPRVSYAQLTAMLWLSADTYPSENIAEVLGKRILECVVAYADSHGLDREKELTELIGPVEKMARKKNNSSDAKAIAGLYAIYATAIITVNPFVAMVGLVAWTAQVEENEKNIIKLQKMTKTVNRRKDIETSGLLEETEITEISESD